MGVKVGAEITPTMFTSSMNKIDAIIICTTKNKMIIGFW